MKYLTTNDNKIITFTEDLNHEQEMKRHGWEKEDVRGAGFFRINWGAKMVETFGDSVSLGMVPHKSDARRLTKRMS